MMRAPRFAGRLYFADAGRLRAAVTSYIEDATSFRVDGAIVGLIVPHGALAICGPVAGYAYKLLLSAPLVWDAVTLLAPGRTLPAGALACDPAEAYDLLTDPAPVDLALLQALRASGVAILDAGDDEPDIEIHLPFLQAALGEVQMLPLRVAAGADAQALDRHAGQLGLLVAIANLPASYEQAACEAIARLDAAFFSSADGSPAQKPRGLGLGGLFSAKSTPPQATADAAVLGLALRAARAAGANAGALIRRNDQMAACVLLRR